MTVVYYISRYPVAQPKLFRALTGPKTQLRSGFTHDPYVSVEIFSGLLATRETVAVETPASREQCNRTWRRGIR